MCRLRLAYMKLVNHTTTIEATGQVGKRDELGQLAA